MPFWKKSKKYELHQTPKNGNPKSDIVFMEHPNVVLKKYTIIGDTSSDSEITTTSKFNLLPPLSSKNIRERRQGSSSVINAEQLNKYFPDRCLKLYVATWNMEGKKFPENIDDLLLPSDDDYGKDVYVIGIQEGYPKRHEWELKIQQTLGPDYVMYHSSGHGVLYLTIFIRRELIWFCSEVECAHVTTRKFHFVKTKGALGVAFAIFGTSFLFITSHLRFGAVHKRIQDYKIIKEGLQLPKKVLNCAHKSVFDVTNRFDRVFWFGDLNFQLTKDRKTVESLLQKISGKDVTSLLQHDSLNDAKNDGSIFRGFREPKIEFLPTYKFDIGTDNYDTSVKQRIPSYTDRILYKSEQDIGVQVLKYDSCPHVKTSDHRPVYGVFEVKLKPGTDDIPLAGGEFARKLFLAGI